MCRVASSSVLRSPFSSFCFGLLFSLSFAHSSWAADLLVPSQYPTIQSAIAASTDGDSVVVSPGMYFENIEFLGKAIHVRSLLGPEQTTINGSAAPFGSPGSVVRFSEQEGPGSILEGFTLMGGSGTPMSLIPGANPVGGGVVVLTGGSPIIRGNHIRQNFARAGGGGVFCLHSSPRIEGNRVVDNAGNVGGGIGVFQGTPTITNNLISNNTGKHGGGVSLSSGGLTAILEHNTIAHNHATVLGGGIHTNSVTTEVRNSIVFGNTAGHAGDEYVGAFSGQWIPHFTHCVVGAPVPGENNYFVNPQFVDSAGGDFHLLPDSPAIDAGDTSLSLSLTFDLDGNPRRLCTTVDIGAFEAPPPAGGCDDDWFMRGDADGSGTLGIGDAIVLLSELFVGGEVADQLCADACDVNDDGDHDLSDPLVILAYLFTQGPPPETPTTECGTDPTPDSSGCESYLACP